MSRHFALLRPFSGGFPGRYMVVSLLSLFGATRLSWLALKFDLFLFDTTLSCIKSPNLIHSSGAFYAGFEFHLIGHQSINKFLSNGQAFRDWVTVT